MRFPPHALCAAILVALSLAAPGASAEPAKPGPPAQAGAPAAPTPQEAARAPDDPSPPDDDEAAPPSPGGILFAIIAYGMRHARR